MPAIPFASGMDVSRSYPLNRMTLVNGFVEAQPQSSKSQMPIFGVPGLSDFSLPGAGPIRGMWVANDQLFVVSGSQLYSVDALGFPTLIGTGIGGYGPVSMSDNGVQLCLTSAVAGGFIYTFAVGTTPGSFQEITDPAFYPANTVTFLDGYFVFDRAGTNEYFLSNLYDGLTYNALDFASAEAAPGKVVATIQNLQVEFIFCTKHIELWYDAGTADFPFARYPGGVINKGLVSPNALVLEDDMLFFLGTDKIFYQLAGNTPRRISGHSQEHVIAQDPDLSQALCFSYTLEGHKLVHLVLPASKVTMIYDLSTQRWHERESWNAKNQSLGRWRGNCVAVFNNNTYIGDAFDNHVGLLDWTVNTEYGNTIRLLAYSQTYHQDRHRIFISRFELDVESGVGLANGYGADPEIRLESSRDGGRTWGMLDPSRAIGVRGNYLARQRWLRMGNARQWTFRISITDPVKRVIIAAHADMQVGQ